MSLAFAPRTLVLTMCRNFADSHDPRTRNGVLEEIRVMRVHKLCWFAVFKSQEWRSGTIQDRQDATVG
eukprot:4080216-Pyramimonas_sp.AAC.1